MPIQDTPRVLTAAGRRDVQQRLERAQEALAKLDERMKSGERTPEDIAEHERLTSQIEQLTAILEQSADVAEVDEDPTIVEIGDEVDIEDEDGEVETYALVDPAEANASEGRVSVESPLGQALLGARPGDKVVVQAPGGSYTCIVRDRRRLE